MNRFLGIKTFNPHICLRQSPASPQLHSTHRNVGAWPWGLSPALSEGHRRSCQVLTTSHPYPSHMSQCQLEIQHPLRWWKKLMGGTLRSHSLYLHWVLGAQIITPTPFMALFCYLLLFSAWLIGLPESVLNPVSAHDPFHVLPGRTLCPPGMEESWRLMPRLQSAGVGRWTSLSHIGFLGMKLVRTEHSRTTVIGD